MLVNLSGRQQARSFVQDGFEFSQDDLLSVFPESFGPEFIGEEFKPVFSMPGTFDSSGRYTENGIVLNWDAVRLAKEYGAKYQYDVWRGYPPGLMNIYNWDNAYRKFYAAGLRTVDQALLMMKIAGYPVNTETVSNLPSQKLRDAGTKFISDLTQAQRQGALVATAALETTNRNRILAFLAPAIGLAALGFFL